MMKIDCEIVKLYVYCGLAVSDGNESELLEDEKKQPNNQLNTGSLTREPFVYLASTSDNGRLM